MMLRCRNPEIDLQVRLSESAQPIDEPLGGKIRLQADGQNTRFLSLKDSVRAVRDLIEGVPDHTEIVATRFGQYQALALA